MDLKLTVFIRLKDVELRRIRIHIVYAVLVVQPSLVSITPY